MPSDGTAQSRYVKKWHRIAMVSQEMEKVRDGLACKAEDFLKERMNFIGKKTR